MGYIDELAAVCKGCGAEIQTEVPVSGLTTFRIGGPCRALVTLPDRDSAKTVLIFLREHHILHCLIGRGSNLLCPDAGYDGVILKLGGELSQYLSLSEDGCGIHCGAGVSLKNLCMFALENSLTGLEFAYGIPGSVGGAVYMNAGAYGGEMSQVIGTVTCLQPDGLLHGIPAEHLDFSYRHSVFTEHPDWTVTDAYFMLQKGDPAEIRAKMQDLLGRRKEKQPLEYPSAGSTFKRPAADKYASRLIDECGLKGYTVGGAQVSEKHAGFVVNRGGATFQDVLAVCEHVKETVYAKTGLSLELEPEILQAESR